MDNKNKKKATMSLPKSHAIYIQRCPVDLQGTITVYIKPLAHPT